MLRHAQTNGMRGVGAAVVSISCALVATLAGAVATVAWHAGSPGPASLVSIGGALVGVLAGFRARGQPAEGHGTLRWLTFVGVGTCGVIAAAWFGAFLWLLLVLR